MSLVKDVALDPEVQVGIDRVRSFAERRENWYRPGPRNGWGAALQGDPKRPGNRPEHTLVLEKHGLKCVFSWTVIPEGVVRDLAVSMPGRVPPPSVAFVFAEEFGFTPRADRSLDLPHPGWQVELDGCRVPCLTVVEMTREVAL